MTREWPLVAVQLPPGTLKLSSGYESSPWQSALANRHAVDMKMKVRKPGFTQGLQSHLKAERARPHDRDV